MKSALISFFILILSSVASAQNFKSEFGFRSDNDAYLASGQDQYYTNGLFITFRHALKLRRSSSKTIKKIWEAEIGQYLYNPTTGYTPSVSDVDRPFAAYLYCGLKMNWFKRNEQHFQTTLQVGTIGPNAYGREVQQTLHKIIGFYEIRGWEYQVNNEVGINSSFSYSKLLGRTRGNDFTLNSYVNIGNTFAGAGVGILFRTGKINELFNSASTNSRISNSDDSRPKTELFLFTRPALNYVAYNSTIQGPAFKHEKGPAVFSPNPLLFSQDVGLMYAKKRWSFNFTVTFQSKELKQQKEAQEYGSASIFYRFN